MKTENALLGDMGIMYLDANISTAMSDTKHLHRLRVAVTTIEVDTISHSTNAGIYECTDAKDVSFTISNVNQVD